MSVLPTGWTQKRLGEIALLSGRIGWKGLTAKEYTTDGPLFLSVHSLNYGDLVDFRDAFHISQKRYDESPEIMLKKNDILICKDGAGIGKVGIVPDLIGQTTINSSLLLIRPSEAVVPKYLYYSLLSPYFQRIVNSRLQGATTPHLYQRDIVDFPIYIPSLKEQRRIVDLLGEVFGGIATAMTNTEKNLVNTRELFDSYLRSVFRQGTGWQQKSLVEMCALFVDSAHRTPKYQNDGIPALRPRDVVNGTLDLTNAAKVSREEYEIQSKRYRPVAGDIAYSRELSFGWAAPLPDSPEVCLSQGMCLFRPKSSLDRNFLLYILNGPIGRDQAIRAAVGTSHPHINLGDIKAYQIPVPPLTVQIQIVKKLDVLRTDIELLMRLSEQKIFFLEALKQSLLNRAFSGELISPPSNLVDVAAE